MAHTAKLSRQEVDAAIDAFPVSERTKRIAVVAATLFVGGALISFPAPLVGCLLACVGMTTLAVMGYVVRHAAVRMYLKDKEREHGAA